MPEEVAIIKIIGETAGAAVSAGRTGATAAAGDAGKGKTSALGSIMTGVLQGVGIATGIGLVVQIVSNMKSLVSVVSGIFKLVIALFRPLELLVVTLLMPIMLLLKPVVQLVNRVMAPFFKLAMDAMKQGAQNIAGGNAVLGASQIAAGTGIMLMGIGAVITAIAGSAIKLLADTMVNSLVMLLQAVFPMFKNNIAEAGMKAVEYINTGVDTVTANIMLLEVKAAAVIAESVGVKTSEFRTNAVNMILETFTGAKGIEPSFVSNVQNLQNTGIDAFNAMFAAWAKTIKGQSTDKGAFYNDYQARVQSQQASQPKGGTKTDTKGLPAYYAALQASYFP